MEINFVPNFLAKMVPSDFRVQLQYKSFALKQSSKVMGC